MRIRFVHINCEITLCKYVTVSTDYLRFAVLETLPMRNDWQAHNGNRAGDIFWSPRPPHFASREQETNWLRVECRVSPYKMSHLRLRAVEREKAPRIVIRPELIIPPPVGVRGIHGPEMFGEIVIMLEIFYGPLKKE
jgi:hypothetical protein